MLVDGPEARGALGAGHGEHAVELRLAVLARVDLGVRVERGNDRPQPRHLLVGHEVGLVEEDDVRALDLLHKEVDDGAHGRPVEAVEQRREGVVGRRRGEVRPVLDGPRLRVGREEGRRVHDGHERVERDGLEQRHARGLRVLELVAQIPRLRDAGGLDDDVVVGVALGRGDAAELGERAEELVGHGAADAAVADLHELRGLVFPAALERRVHELRVDVDRGHVVDDDADLEVRVARRGL